MYIKHELTSQVFLAHLAYKHIKILDKLCSKFIDSTSSPISFIQKIIGESLNTKVVKQCVLTVESSLITSIIFEDFSVSLYYFDPHKNLSNTHSILYEWNEIQKLFAKDNCLRLINLSIGYVISHF